MKNSISTFILVLFSIIAFGQKNLTQDIIDKFGTKVFEASKDEVFLATKNALESNDYVIDFANAEKGKIITKKKVLGETGISTGPGSAQFTRNYRQYYVTFESLSPTKTKIVMTPKVWVGEADVSEKKVWVIKGVAGEIQLWENIFNSIQERL